ncbi:aldo/keto reductase [Pelagibacterales bacterium SAG-MED32]|nr:aldo/keto reductase [Pelagibacterales bacterium SAG-MED32]
MKLSLGTAQFTDSYGILSNQEYSLNQNQNEISKIVQFSRVSGINMIDTAQAYTGSEEIVGNQFDNDFDVVTKININYKCENEREILNNINLSLKRLRRKSLHGLLVHDSSLMLGKYAENLYKLLIMCKEKGIVKKIGISFYSPQDYLNINSKFKFDIVQAPVNIFDQRLISSGLLEKLKTNNIEIHARSIFLQGILLCKQKQLPKRFDKWRQQWGNYHNWLNEHSLSPIDGCLSFLKSIHGIDYAVVGFESLSQLKMIYTSFNKETIIQENNLASSDLLLIDPRTW